MMACGGNHVMACGGNHVMACGGNHVMACGGNDILVESTDSLRFVLTLLVTESQVIPRFTTLLILLRYRLEYRDSRQQIACRELSCCYSW